MGRIRSVNPRFFTDEDLVTVSMPARLLIIGLGIEADDKGVFEWKLATLKMRLFPADNVDVGPLMDELKAIDAIRLYEIDGRKYGAIRNFRVFQRPKSPNDVHPMPDDFRKYVGLASGISPAFPRKGEIAPQVEDGEEDVGKQKGKKEGGASAHRTSEEFAFEGRTIRLKRADLDQWQTRFYAIPDITAELTALDGWLGKQSAEKRKGWFHSVPGMLNRKHQEMVSASRAVLATSDDEELPIA